MLLGRPWLRDAKVTHDWGNNVITIQHNGIVKTISDNKKLGVKTKRPQIIVCYDLLEGLTYEEEDVIFEIKPKLFSISTIIISYEVISLLSTKMSKVKINGKSNTESKTSDQGIIEVLHSTTNTTKFHVRPKTSLENKVYP
jgi:hypothetical protein